MNKTVHRKFILVTIIVSLICNEYVNIVAQDVLPDSLVKERIQVIQDMLNHGRKGANIWWKGWLIGYSTATVAQSALAIGSDNLKGRQDWTLGAISTLLGAAGQVIAPMTLGYTKNELEEMPEETAEEKMLKLQEAERLLEECAIREKSGRSWKTHTLDGAVNVGFGLVVWFGFRRTFTEGITNFAMNTAICEVQIFTQPTRAIKDYNYYCQKYKPGMNPVTLYSPVTWYFTMVPGGAGIRIVF